ncbi:hypothetical protein SDD27957_10655 [Streptococcus dysgalactiae subsp. dysgalactiae ATCC 27957]|nr:hypothetical protein SDD27957_10655 [Streptococcus dysgalactiae subsp. dysgalactiae ATCC 27957]
MFSATPQVLQFGKPQEALAATEIINNFYHTIYYQPAVRPLSAPIASFLCYILKRLSKKRNATLKKLGFLGVAVNTVLETD